MAKIGLFWQKSEIWKNAIFWQRSPVTALEKFQKWNLKWSMWGLVGSLIRYIPLLSRTENWKVPQPKIFGQKVKKSLFTIKIAKIHPPKSEKSKIRAWEISNQILNARGPPEPGLLNRYMLLTSRFENWNIFKIHFL